MNYARELGRSSLSTVIAAALSLSACGGGGSGGSMASAPPPAQATVIREEFREFVPLDSNPAWSSGNYETIAMDRSTGTREPAGAAARAVEAAYKWSSASPIYGSGGTQRIGTAEFSIDAGGLSPIGNSGSFTIELTGTGIAHFTRNDGASQPDQTMAVDGRIAGAFFGSRGVEVGGVYRLPGLGLIDYNLPGLAAPGNLVTTLSQGAFIAVRD